ncbi:hypothetical protein NQZ79_g2646 [Umbelopsis isabellina]|nr:hypothetical protein NQZ79_g2646 [Umbelopsis isabellina]
MKLLTLIGFVGAIASASAAAVPQATSAVSGKTVKVSEDSLCIFMPQHPGEEIALSEPTAVAFCNSTNAVSDARQIPEGFIKSAHYLAGSGDGKYVQYTGSIDPSKYELKKNDGGGQYDNHGSGNPAGSTCEGYPYYVALIEPDIERFCIRCCDNYQDCNAGRSTYGCQRVVPGDFS